MELLRLRARLALLKSGSPGLVFEDADGKISLVIALSADGTPQLRLHDAEGKTPLFEAP